jgi:hypothetical protein
MRVLDITYVNLQEMVCSSAFSAYTVMPVPIQGSETACRHLVLLVLGREMIC